MSAWGPAAWENDAAADWFGDMFDATGLAKYVEETLQRDVEDSHEEIRAAAHVLVTLGDTFMWPIDDLDNDLSVAISKLQEIKALDIYREVPDFVKAIDEEIAILTSRFKQRSD
ncbi:MAG TPA: hypothetical protein VKE94_00030 [Gemmataceae bacterium]|nr:hypothetical protein [Gemmataceae bacterium]